MKARNTHIGKKSRDWLRVVYGALVVDMLQADFSLFRYFGLLFGLKKRVSVFDETNIVESWVGPPSSLLQ